MQCRMRFQRRCSKCNLTSHEDQEHLLLHVSLMSQGATELVSAFAKSIVSVREQRCVKCESQQDRRHSIRLHCFLHLPKYLFFHIKRFYADTELNRLRRNDAVIDVPVDLTIKLQHSHITYKLCAVVCQQGSLEAGHYYSYIAPQVPEAPWLRCDDSNVTNTPWADVSADIKTKAYLVLFVQESQ